MIFCALRLPGPFSNANEQGLEACLNGANCAFDITTTILCCIQLSTPSARGRLLCRRIWRRVLGPRLLCRSRGDWDDYLRLPHRLLRCRFGRFCFRALPVIDHLRGQDDVEAEAGNEAVQDELVIDLLYGSEDAR